MSKLEVNAVEPQCGTNLTLGANGDTIIIPSGATISNQGTAAGFGPTGAVSWNTTKITADPNPAVSGVGYFADTTSAAFTITLPSSPSAGAVIGIADYANTFATNNITVDRNGSNIGGLAENPALSTNGVSITLVYVDATQGWIITDSGQRSNLITAQYIAATGGTETTSPCGDYKIHTFTGPGTFTVCSVGNPLGSTTVDYLVVAGGGGAGNSNGGGGGAGGYRESSGTASGCYSASPLGSGVSALPVSVQGYPITVGSGGAGQPGPEPQASGKGVSGSPSIFSTIISAGGGGGGSGLGPGPGNAGATGGSGGGGGTNNGTAGAGNTPPTNPSQGNSGSNGGNSPTIPYQAGGGGGGASAAGVVVTPSPQKAGDGGAGATSSINATPTARAGGGGGGASPGTTAGSGGSGGGGAGNISGTGTAGTVNTGGGGGGGSGPGPGAGGAGGSGIVIIRYKFQN